MQPSLNQFEKNVVAGLRDIFKRVAKFGGDCVRVALDFKNEIVDCMNNPAEPVRSFRYGTFAEADREKTEPEFINNGQTSDS